MNVLMRRVAGCVLFSAVWGLAGCMLPQPDTPPIPPVFRPGAPNLPLVPAPSEKLNRAPAKAAQPMELGNEIPAEQLPRADRPLEPPAVSAGLERSPEAGAISADASAGLVAPNEAPASSVIPSEEASVPLVSTEGARATLYSEIVGAVSSVMLRPVGGEPLQLLPETNLELPTGEYALEAVVGGLTVKASQPLHLSEARLYRIRIVVEANGLNIEILDG